MNEDNPTGEVRPMIDREPPNADKTHGAVVGKTVLRDLRGWFEPSEPCLAGETAYRRPSGAGIRGISRKDNAVASAGSAGNADPESGRMTKVRFFGSGCAYWCGALAFAFVIPMAALPLTASASDDDVRAFLGFWEGVDPLDGSTVQVSISDIEGDGILELVNAESFWTVCFELGNNYSLGRGLVTGQGSVVGNGVLEVETTLTCIDDDNNPAPPSVGTFEWTLESNGKILVLPEIDQSPGILLHRTSRSSR
jgi:hypothetical protein